jgi:hypothetical protein
MMPVSNLASIFFTMQAVIADASLGNSNNADDADGNRLLLPDPSAWILPTPSLHYP